MVWVIAFGELFFGDLWCVVWGYGGMRTHFSLLNPLFIINVWGALPTDQQMRLKMSNHEAVSYHMVLNKPTKQQLDSWALQTQKPGEAAYREGFGSGSLLESGWIPAVCSAV